MITLTNLMELPIWLGFPCAWFAGHGFCNLAFGVGSFGSSLLWCGIVVGAGGAYFGGKHGGQIFGKLGELVYRGTYK